MKRFKIKPYNEKNGDGVIRHILIRKGFATGEIMVCIVINTQKLPYKEQLCTALSAIKGVESIMLNINRSKTNVIMGQKTVNIYGKNFISDYIGNIRFNISAESFYQVNPVQTNILYNKVLEFADLKGDETVWDLYCGIGTISLFLAQKAGRVYGIETVQKAVEDLAVKVEVMIIVGDIRSSNTKKLYEISKKLNDNSYLVENEEQLDLTIFRGKEVVGITAGASTPEETIMNIEKKIRGIYKMSNANENQNEFSLMLEEFLPNQEKRVEGVIESMDQNYSYLDVPGERTAVRVRTDELKGYKVGDTVEVLITGLSEEDDDQEYITASRRKIEVEKNWEKIEDSFKNKTILDAKVTKKIKGGYLVEAFLYPGFLPNSLSEISDSEEKVNGKKIQVIVKDIKVDPKDKKNRKITYSVKDIRLAEQEKEFAGLTVGQIVDCVVTEVLDFGLAVDINTLKGFIHISEVSWKRLDKLSDVYKVGDHIKAVIVSLDEAKRNVKLSIKKLEEDPWATVANEFKVDDEVEGTVTKVLPYGAFVEIKPGVEGLVHISDFSWTKKKVNVAEYVKEGEKVKVRITDLHPEDRKLKLGIKQLVANPWETAEKDFAVGTVIKGKVVEVKPFGIFVEIADGIDAFVHSSDYSWIGEETPKFEIGNEVELKITELDLNDKKIKGSLKALRKSPWEHAMEEYKVGTTVEKKIKTVADFGLFIELTKGIDGFIPTQFASKEFIKNIRDKFNEGDVVKAQVVEVNKDTQKIKLSIKKIEIEEEKREEREQIEKYSTSSSEE